MADFEQLPGESAQAYKAFTIYRNLPSGKRSLAAVSHRIAVGRRKSGFVIIREGESPARAPKGRRKKTGRVGLWSRKFRWQERAAAWDQMIDLRLREKQVAEIEKMAERHARQSQLAIEALMQPALAFARALQDPKRAAILETAPLPELFKMSVQAASALPKLQKAERLSRGVKVLDTEPISNPASPQGEAEWRVTIYQPERKGPLPCLDEPTETIDEWEEADDVA
jgi:hypothetical protein